MFFKLVMLCSFFVVSQCCTCAETDPLINSSYCASDIVAKVNVTKVMVHGKSQESDDSEYEVKYLEIFKKPANFNKKHDTIKTTGTASACGVEIKNVKPKGVIYLLSIQDSSINNCAFNKPWNNDFKKELQAMAKHNCENHTTPKPHQ